jgi:hypothetical protein
MTAGRGGGVEELLAKMGRGFDGVSLDGCSVAYYVQDEVLEAIQREKGRWSDVPVSYFEEMGFDAMGLSCGQKLIFLLPSAVVFSLQRLLQDADAVTDLTVSVIGRLADVAAGLSECDRQTQELLTNYQCHVIYLYLQFVVDSDCSESQDAANAIESYFGAFRECSEV